jgi:hypothetical protein
MVDLECRVNIVGQLQDNNTVSNTIRSEKC